MKEKLDILIGAAGIAEYLGLTVRQTNRLIYSGDLPTFHLGGSRAARKATLQAWVEAKELAA